MKIQIQNWWKAEILEHKPHLDIPEEEVIERCGHITICTVIIDDKVVGGVTWDGKELKISRQLLGRTYYYCHFCGAKNERIKPYEDYACGHCGKCYTIKESPKIAVNSN